MAANQPRLCGICCAPDHPTNACPTLQETEHATDVSAIQSRKPFKPQQKQNNPSSYTYNPGWRDNLNLMYGPGPQQHPFKQQQYQSSTSKYQAPPFRQQQ